MLSVGSNLMGMFGGASEGSQSSEIAERQLAIQQALADMGMEFAEGAWENEQEAIDYIYGQNEDFGTRQLDYADYARSWQDEQQNLRLLDYLFANERLGRMDQAMQEDRQRAIQQWNQQMGMVGGQWQTAQRMADESRELAIEARDYDRERLNWQREQLLGERDWAIDRLMQDIEQAQAERGEAAGRLSEDRATARAERGWDEAQFLQQVEQLQRERAYEVARNELIRNRAGDLGDTLQRTLSGLGELAPANYRGEPELNQARQMFMEQYGSAADRAVDRLASVNEAQLINRGVDTSTTGDVSRRDLLAEQVQPMYNEMVAKATQDALGYITGLNEQTAREYQDRLAGRERALSEVSQAFTPEIDALLQIRNAPSAASGDWASLSTSIIDRNLPSAIVQRDLPTAISPFQTRSGADYRAPLSPTGGMPSVPGSMPGMANQLAPPVASYGTQYSGVSPYGPNQLWNPLSWLTSASNFLGSVRPGNPGQWADRAAGGWQQAGQSARGLAEGLSGLFGDGPASQGLVSGDGAVDDFLMSGWGSF